MKVEYKSQERFPFESRYVWYRKDLSDVPWWKRMFISNPWRKVYRSFKVCLPDDKTIEDCLQFIFNSREANEIAEKYKTVEELEKFLSEEKRKAETMLLHMHPGEILEDWRF